MAKKNVFKKFDKKIQKFEKKHEVAAVAVGSFTGCIAALICDRSVRSIRARRAEKRYQKQLAEQAAKAAKVTNPEVLEEVPTT